MTGLPKPERRETRKRREERIEHALIAVVRAVCVERDGYCRLMGEDLHRVGPCSGPSEWAHMEGHRRFETRGMAPERRHATAWTLMLCRRHHGYYDAGAFWLECMSERGADGALVPRRR